MGKTKLASGLVGLLALLTVATACRDHATVVTVESTVAAVHRVGDRSMGSSAYERITLGSGIAFAINSNGQIAGWMKSDEACTGACAYHAVLWQKGTVTHLGGASLYLDEARPDPFYNWNMPILAPMGMNDQGHVVGSFMPAPGAPYHAFWWHDGGLEDLGPGHAYDINEHGQITVVLGTPGTGFEASIWDDGDLTPIVGHVPGAIVIPRALNNRGQVAGFHVWSWIAGGWWFGAFLWEDGVIQDLGVPVDAAALDINERGQIVGTAKASETTYVGFLWQNGGLTEVGQGLEHTWIMSINRPGLFVGNWNEWEISWIPFVWQKGEMCDLPGGADDYPVNINSRGQIVGYNCGGGCTSFSEVTALLWEVR